MALDYEKAFVIDKKFVIRDINYRNDNFEPNSPIEQRIVGLNCYELFYGFDKPCPDCPVPRALQSNMCVESTIHYSPGRIKPGRKAKALPLITGNGTTSQIVVDCLDDELIQNLQQTSGDTNNPFLPSLFASYPHSVEPRNDGVDVASVTAQIVHRVNNHIAVILGQLSKQGVDCRSQEQPADPSDCGPSIYNQVIQILDYFERVQLPQPFTKDDLAFVDLEKLIETAISSTKIAYPRNNVNIHFYAHKPMPLCRCSEFQISQALTHLLNNAFEAIVEEGEIGMALKFDDATQIFHIVINDNGSGIKKDDLAHVFDPFFTTKKKKRAAGMGLTVAARILNFHGGSILVSSQEQKGTSVKIGLPDDAANKKAS